MADIYIGAGDVLDTLIGPCNYTKWDHTGCADCGGLGKVLTHAGQQLMAVMRVQMAAVDNSAAPTPRATPSKDGE